MHCIDMASLLRASCQLACFQHASLPPPTHPVDASTTSSSSSSSARTPHAHHLCRAPKPPEAPPSQRALLLQLVCPYLSPRDRRHLRASCADGRLAANAAVTAATFLPADPDPAPTPPRLAFLAACPNLRAVRLLSLHADRALAALLPLPNLRAVHAVHLDTPLFIPPLSLCLMAALWTNLQTLHLHAGPGGIPPDLLAALAPQPHLRSLTLLGCQAVASTEWTPLVALRALTHLHLAHVRHLPFLTLAALLAPLPHLASLALTASALYHEPTDPRNASALASLRSLTALRLHHTSGLPPAAALSPPALRHLSLAASLPPAAPLPRHLPPALTYLDLSRNPLPPVALPPLAPLSALAHLDLSHTSAAPTPADLLPAAATLTHLDLTACALTPPTYHAALPHLTRLTHLAFSAAPRSLAPLAPLTALRALHAPSVPLDRASVPPLAALPLLHTLTCRAIALWPALPPLAALTALTATAAHKFTDYDFADVAAVTTPALASLTLHHAAALTPDAVPHLIRHLPSLTALTLSGLFALPPPAAALVAAHPALRSVSLAFPAAGPDELQLLQDHLEACRLSARCCNELPASSCAPPRHPALLHAPPF